MIDKIVQLIADTSSSLPEDVLAAIRKAAKREERGSAADVCLKTILENCALAKKRRVPLCQDTGTLAFYVDEQLRRRVTPSVIKKAVAIATERGYLRKNTIDSITGKSYDDNCADGAPVIHYYPLPSTLYPLSSTLYPLPSTIYPLPSTLYPLPSITLLMKGGGSENMSRQYSLPDSELGAGRDLAGVRKCILDAVQKIQGYGCAPGILGVCIGGDRATAYEVAKEQLLRPLDEKENIEPSNRQIVELEKTILKDANSLGIGPMGLGGKTTLLGVKIAARTRVPASFFVTIAYMCWACRRHTILIK